jgi:hypothetical protein
MTGAALLLDVIAEWGRFVYSISHDVPSHGVGRPYETPTLDTIAD